MSTREWWKLARICTKCKKMTPLDEFWALPTGKDGLNSWCKVCMREQRAVKNKNDEMSAKDIDKAFKGFCL